MPRAASVPGLPPAFARWLRAVWPLIIDWLWMLAAVVLGLVLSEWICAALGLPVPLPVEPLLIL